MFLLNLIILQCGFCVNGLFYESIILKNSSYSSTIINEFMTKCNYLKPQFAIIIDDINYNSKNLFFNINLTSIILFDDKSMVKNSSNDEIISIQSKLFIINTHTERHLNGIIERLKLSMWWNINGFYIVINTDNKNNCHRAFNYLWIMWKMDLINVIFICRDVNNNIIIFTYNPYSKRAPDIWKISNQMPKNHRSWTLLTCPYEEALSICWSLNYDKTKNFDGYSGIKAAAFQSPGMIGLNLDDDEVTNMLFDTLNLTRNYTVDTDRGYVDGGGIAYGMIKNLTNGNYDIIINSRYPAYAKGVKMSTIISQSGLAIASQPRGYLSIVKKIIDYFPLWLFITIFILSIVTSIVLKYSLINITFGTTMTEVIGFFLDGNYLTLPIFISSRIYLFVIFLFVLIIQSLFRGRILAFLTIPVPERNMDTFNDLIDNKNIKILCDFGMRKFVDTNLKNRCLNISASLGMKQLLIDSQSCFLSDKYIIIRYMINYNSYWLHLSRDRVIKEYGVFMMRNNWPLSNRISQGVSRMFESGLSGLVYKRVYGVAIRKIESIEDRHLIRRFRSIKLRDLIFAFELWLIGIILTLIIFIIEMQNDILRYLRNIFVQ